MSELPFLPLHDLSSLAHACVSCPSHLQSADAVLGVSKPWLHLRALLQCAGGQLGTPLHFGFVNLMIAGYRRPVPTYVSDEKPQSASIVLNVRWMDEDISLKVAMKCVPITPMPTAHLERHLTFSVGALPLVKQLDLRTSG